MSTDRNRHFLNLNFLKGFIQSGQSYLACLTFLLIATTTAYCKVTASYSKRSGKAGQAKSETVQSIQLWNGTATTKTEAESDDADIHSSKLQPLLSADVVAIRGINIIVYCTVL